MDATFFPAKKGSAVGKTKRGKGTKCMVLADGKGIPLEVLLASASPHKVTLAEPTAGAGTSSTAMSGTATHTNPAHCCRQGDDSDPLRRQLWKRGIELIVPYRFWKAAAAVLRWPEAAA